MTPVAAWYGATAPARTVSDERMRTFEARLTKAIADAEGDRAQALRQLEKDYNQWKDSRR